jgi:hypothetical protein
VHEISVALVVIFARRREADIARPAAPRHGEGGALANATPRPRVPPGLTETVLVLLVRLRPDVVQLVEEDKSCALTRGKSIRRPVVQLERPLAPAQGATEGTVHERHGDADVSSRSEIRIIRNANI